VPGGDGDAKGESEAGVVVFIGCVKGEDDNEK